ncbi:isoamyl acetate-hydrolyzing esterase [Rhodotorula kratochvilovae]
MTAIDLEKQPAQMGQPASSDSAGGKEHSIRMDQVVLFGDSITQGSWRPGGTGAVLADAWQRKLDVVNRGFSGYNTDMGLEVIKQFLPRAGEGLPKMALFVVWFGANDAACPPSPQSMTIEHFKANLNTILDMIRLPSSPWYAPKTQLLLLTPPPVDDGVRNSELASRTPARVPDRDAERTRLFAEAVKEVGREGKIPVVDVWGRIMQFARDNEGGRLEKYLSDGLHLTAEGYRIVTAGISELLYAEYPHLYWENMEQRFPHWTHFIAPSQRF